MVAISRDLEAVLAFSPDAAQMHELADTLLAYPDAPRPQLLPCARPTTGAVSFSADNLGVGQQRVVADMATLRRAGASHEVLVVPGHAPLQDQTLDRDGPHAMVATNEGVLQLCAFAKYAVAFLRMSRSIFTRANCDTQPADLHLLGTDDLRVNAFELAQSIGLDPVKQRLIDQTRRPGHKPPRSALQPPVAPPPA